MCSADLTMEPHSPSDADDNGPLDGSWNGHHGRMNGPIVLGIVLTTCSVQRLRACHSVSRR